MRSFKATLGGKSVTFKADFAASMRIAEEVGDPLVISREANMEAFFASRDIPYEPKWRFTAKNVVATIEIGTGLELEEVQELVFKEGFLGAREIASRYLAEIIGPQPETELEPAEDAEPEK